jgi:hypothetical protein
MLADDVDFGLLGDSLGADVESAIDDALACGAMFLNASQPLQIFRDALSTAIRDIEKHPLGELFQKFLNDGPYEGDGEIPPELKGKRLSDQDTAKVITFVYSYMVNCFKGAVAELLAAGACSRWLREFGAVEGVPGNAQLYVGDSVGLHRRVGRGLLKGPDLAIFIKDQNSGNSPSICLAGVVEVKSYFQIETRLRKQLAQHIEHSRRGLNVAGLDYPADRVHIGYGPERRVVRIAVLPDDWVLPRTYHFETSRQSRLLYVDDGVPVHDTDQIVQTGQDEWRITLRWSKEVLAAAAYEMTFWYMEKVGEIIYADHIPEEWSDMSSAEAGRNAAKMMLYYAMLRCRDKIEQRAIALYNSYSFGYALGMNFINAAGKREMLWPDDLEEILISERTKNGCRIS